MIAAGGGDGRKQRHQLGALEAASPALLLPAVQCIFTRSRLHGPPKHIAAMDKPELCRRFASCPRHLTRCLKPVAQKQYTSCAHHPSARPPHSRSSPSPRTRATRPSPLHPWPTRLLMCASFALRTLLQQPPSRGTSSRSSAVGRSERDDSE
jgi:hypothetical protein